MYVCDVCGLQYVNKYHLQRHVRQKHPERYRCEQCNLVCPSQSSLNRHVRESHPKEESFRCRTCALDFPSMSSLRAHNNAEHRAASADDSLPTVSPPFRMVASALRNFCTRYTYDERQSTTDFALYHDTLRAEMERLFRRVQRHIHQMKFIACFTVTMKKNTIDGEEKTTTSYFCSTVQTILTADDIESEIDRAMNTIRDRIDRFVQHGSGWTIASFDRCDFHFGKYVPLSGGCHVQLDAYLRKKRAVLNVQNTDNKCFVYAVLGGLHPIPHGKHSYRIHHYRRYESELNLKDIHFPTPLTDISKFERNNDITVHVYGYEEKTVFPLRISEYRGKNEVLLLLLEENHYCLIRNFNRLCRSKRHKYVCPYCISSFRSKTRLEEHKVDCCKNTPQKLEMPKIDYVNFERYDKQLPVPFIVYADFECILQKLHTCLPSTDHSYVHRYQKHVPCGFCYIIIDNEKRVIDRKLYRGEDCVEKFFTFLQDDYAKISKFLCRENKPIAMTVTDESAFQNSSICHICEKRFVDNDVKVRDHCHLSGKFRGAAHQKCNLMYRYKKVLPVFFHNFKSYDSHLLVHGLSFFKNDEISVIPQSGEKFIAMKIRQLLFLDSFHFLSSSLDTLVSTLTSFPILQSYYPENVDLLSRKGIYPYEYVDDFDKFSETSLPRKDCFYSSLNEECITDDDYAHAARVWDAMGCRTMGDYHDLYLTTDVLLLADVFENFRDVSLRYYKLDPAHYFSLPGLSWDGALKMTGEKIELLTDIDMYLFFEKGIRGGVSMISHRYAKANNPYVEGYDSSRENSYIVYYDANNLYGWALSQPLPHSNFRWMDETELTLFDVNAVDDDSDVGYVLEVDMDYPNTLHDEHSDYPLAPEHITITADALSPYNKSLHDLFSFPRSTKKLSPTLSSKTKYVLHYRNLKFYQQHGMVLRKIHRGISFSQKAWLKPFIDFNTVKRQSVSSTFEKDFFKLLNNSIYGKSIENLRKRINIKLATSLQRAQKLMSKPTVSYFDVISEDVVLFKMHRLKIILNKPVFIGFTVLDLSKLVMYKFHYDYMRQNYKEQCQLLFTDTDSLTYLVKTEDIYRDMEQNLHVFDTSNYPSDHFLYSVTNKKLPGKFKDETDGVPISEFVGLKSKMYSLVYGNKKVKKVGKGIKKKVLRDKITHENYLHALREKKTFSFPMRNIRSFKHAIFTTEMQKLCLNAYDDKRYVADDGVSSLPYGHYKIQRE